MSRKRRNTSSPEPDESPAKRPRSQSVSSTSNDDVKQSRERPQVDPYSGQSGAFPGLGDGDEEIFYGPASDGIEYLRMVRSEARSVPSLLVAPASRPHNSDTPNENELAEEGGYFEDGTYIACPRPEKGQRSTQLSLAQERYYDGLLAQFGLVQATMRCIPPLSRVQLLDPSRLISFPPDSKIARDQWEKHMVQNYPHPVQIACMDSETVLETVKFMKRKFFVLMRNGGMELRSRLSAWIWAVLGKCKDLGELGSEEVGELRGLAQKAVDMLKSYDTSKDALTLGSNSDSSQAVGSHQEKEERESAGSGLLQMTLDMVITIVGEVYGQRDLLDARTIWDCAVRVPSTHGKEGG